MRSVVAPTYTMEHCVKSIAIEAAVLDNLAATLKKFLPSFISGIEPEVKKFDDVVNAPVVELTKDQSKAVAKLAHIEYHYLRQLTFDATEGFGGNFLTYLKELHKQLDYVKETAAHIKEYRAFLSGVLSDGDARLSTKDLTSKHLGRTKIRKELEKDLAQFIMAGSHATSVRIGDVFDRSSDVAFAIKEAAGLESARKTINLAQIKSDVHACVDLLNTIIARMQDDTIKNLTPAAAKNLSTGAYEMAESVEYVSVVYYTTLTAVVATNRLIEKVNIF